MQRIILTSRLKQFEATKQKRKCTMFCILINIYFNHFLSLSFELQLVELSSYLIGHMSSETTTVSPGTRIVPAPRDHLVAPAADRLAFPEKTNSLSHVLRKSLIAKSHKLIYCF